MNDFESERAAKAARFRQLAEKHENIATGRHFAARERLEMIPLGQPILVGHHSEKRHRKDLKRIDQHFAEAKEHHDKAEYFRRRAAAAESNVVIFSDDPDATEKLVDKIERLKKRQGVMKRANQLIRKADREGLADLGFSEETITKLFSQDYAGRVGFPNYALTNNSANIRRLEKRLADLQQAQSDVTTEEEFGCWGATEQLWNAFHNCSYGKFTNMESLVPKGICKTLIVRQFWLRSALIFFA